MDIITAIAAHKTYRIPADPMYVPIQAGAKGKPTISMERIVEHPDHEKETVHERARRDDTGDNISELNPYYCELTCLYWAWKNTDSDALGLTHYRRHFKSPHASGKDPFDQILTGQEAEKLLKEHDIVLPKRRDYVIASVYKHYASTHYAKDLDAMRRIIARRQPACLDAFDRHMKETSGHMFNMFIMKRDKADEYLRFLFPLLDELYRQTDMSQYDAFQARMIGRISELLLDVWIEANGYDYVEVPVVSMEKVNWLKKGTSFVRSLLTGKKYDHSF